MNVRKTTKLVREGRYAVDVEVELLDEDHPWAPYISAGDVEKLDRARAALRSGDLKQAATLGKVFELLPV